MDDSKDTLSTPICYYESYPNSSTGTSASTDDNKDQPCESDASPIYYYESYPNLSACTGNSSSIDYNKDQPWESDPSPLCYYESYPNLSACTGNSSSIDDSKDQPWESDPSPICYYESYPNASNTTSSTKKSQLQSEYRSNKPPATESQSTSTIVEFNFLGLPIRPGEKECHYYMRFGLCKYESNCKFNHPNPTAEGDSDFWKKPLSPATYRDYFAALLYAEDLYLEKWSNFRLLNVTLEFHEASVDDMSPNNKNLKKRVALKIDSVPQRRSYILSKDFVFARRLGSEAKKFRGIVSRVVQSDLMLVEFEEEFYSQHDQKHKYNVSFSFNRVWLKRAHQAISAVVSGPLLEKHLFPERAVRKKFCSSSSAPCIYNNHKLDLVSNSAIRQILNFKGHPPYLIEGRPCARVSDTQKLSKTGLVVREAVLQIYQRSSSTCRILICYPQNSTGDVLLKSLKSEISESVMFRANAAFREVDGIPLDILSFSVYDGEWVSFPSLQQLKQFRIIFSTFVSSFRLLNEGITVGYFSHIFLVDASSATEPETVIPLSNFADENTTVVLTGDPNNQTTTWVRSDIARKNGLRISFFERLRAAKIYQSSDPSFIMRL